MRQTQALQVVVVGGTLLAAGELARAFLVSRPVVPALLAGALALAVGAVSRGRRRGVVALGLLAALELATLPALSGLTLQERLAWAARGVLSVVTVAAALLLMLHSRRVAVQALVRSPEPARPSSARRA